MPLLGTFGAASQQSFAGRFVPGGSALYDVQGDGLYMSPGVPFAYGTGDFTIEMWVYPTAFNVVLWHQGGQSFTTTSVNTFGRVTRTFNDRRYLMLYFNGAGQTVLQLFGTDAYISTSHTATLNAWNHVALVRSSGVVRIFLNGTSSVTAGLGSNFSDTSTYSPFIGRYSYTGSAGFLGYISNVRVAKSAYYLSTPFNPTRSPFTRTSQGATNVQLLLNQSTSARLATDSSSNNLTVTNFNTTWNSFSPFNVPYVPYAVVVAISATVTPSTTTVNEGDTVTFTVAGTNTPNGTYYYTIEQPDDNLTGADFTSGSLSGSFSISGNSGSFTLTATLDLTTEGDLPFAVYVRKDSIAGQVLGNTTEITIIDTSLTPEFTVTPASIDEGSLGSFTVANLGPNGAYFWTINHGTTTADDFSAVSGTFATGTGSGRNDPGSFSITPVVDFLTEGPQTFTVSVRRDSTSGTVLVTSSTVTVNDTSVTNYAVSATPTSFNEGEGTVATFTGAPNGTYFWTVLNGTTANADFTASSGSFTSTSGTGSFSVTAVTFDGVETAQTFQLQVRTGSTGGAVVATTGTLTINASAN
jgi:hypothetical protein